MSDYHSTLNDGNAVAVHEASHHVAALSFSLDVTASTIRPVYGSPELGVDAAGHVKVTGQTTRRASAIVSLAGAEGDRLHYGIVPRGDNQDLRNALLEVDAILIDELREEARRIVTERWPLVISIANRLKRVRELDAADLEHYREVHDLLYPREVA